MPRQARLDMPGALHHIMIRGVNRGDIFYDKQDKRKFLEREKIKGDGSLLLTKRA